MSPEPIVLVVGAGPAGLVMALALSRNGIKVRIIEKDSTFHVGSRGAGLQPRTFELFHTLGIMDDVQKFATPMMTMRAYKLPGGTVPVKTWDMFKKGPVKHDRPYVNGNLSQELLEEILRTHLAKYGVAVELGKALVGIDQGVDTVTATIAAKQPDGTEMQESIVARYLVGSDGAKGSSRKLLGLTFQGETLEADGMVWVDVEIKGLTNDFWHVWGKPGYFTILARPHYYTGNQFSIGITGQNFDPADLIEPAKLTQFIHAETGRTELEFGKFTSLTYFKPNIRMVKKFQEGRVFLVGDSGHVHSPTGGQGVNCSIQDAGNLAWKLALVLKNYARPTLLATYSDERLPVIAQMLQATSVLYTHIVTPEEKAENETGWFRWRNLALLMYGVNYRYSDIILEERDTIPQDKEEALAHAYSGYEGLGVLRAGDRAPEAPGLIHTQHRLKTSLFEQYKLVLHTVLVFTAEGKEQLVTDVIALVKGYPKDAVQIIVISSEQSGDFTGTNVLIDGDGHAHNAYLAQNDTVNIVVVRPDGFIGAIVMDVVGVQRYFSKIFDVDG